MYETLKVIQLLYLYIKWLCRVSRADVSEHIKWIWVRIWLVMIEGYSAYGQIRIHGSLFIHPLPQFGTRLASILDLKNLRQPSIIYLFILVGSGPSLLILEHVMGQGKLMTGANCEGLGYWLT